MSEDPEDPNAWWATRKDFKGLLFNPTGDLKPKQIRRNKWITAVVLLLAIIVAVLFNNRGLTHWVANFFSN